MATNVEASDLDRRGVRGVFWTAGGKLGHQALQFATSAVLARLLAPEAFGLMAMVLVFSNFASLLSNLGLGQAVIQREDLHRRHLDTAFWTNLGAGVALAVLFSLGAPVLAGFYQEPRLTAVTVAVSSVFVVSAPGLLHQALLQRELRMRALSIAELLATLVGGLVAGTIAIAGGGVWSLVAMTLTRELVRTVLVWRASDYRPGRSVDRASLRELWSFSINVTGYNFVNYWARSADNLLIGRMVGQRALGLYSRSYSTMMVPVGSVSRVVQLVLFPVLARLQSDPRRVRRVYLKVLAIQAAIGLPMSVGLLVVAEPLVVGIYGPQWADAVPILRVLCLAGMFQPITATANELLKAMGRTDWLFRWGLVVSGTILASFLVGIPWGAIGVAWSYAGAVTLLTIPAFTIPGRLIGMRLRDVAVAVARPAAAAGLMGIGVTFLLAGPGGSWPQVARLVVAAASGAGLYGMLLWLLDPSLVRDFVRLVRMAGTGRRAAVG